MVDGAPKVAELAVDLHKHLVQVPAPLRIAAHVRDASLTDLGGEHRAKPVPPEPDDLVTDVDPALGQEIFAFRSDSIRFDQADFGAHLRLALRRALARTISFRMIAIKATLAGFPASTSWRYFALRSGLNRVATRGACRGPG